MCFGRRLELMWSQDICKVFTCFVCVLMIWSDCGWSLQILPEELKIEFLALSGRESSQIHYCYPTRACMKGLQNQFCPSVSQSVSLSSEKLYVYLIETNAVLSSAFPLFSI